MINKVKNISPKYRPDIDGLRALGVVPLLAYHAFPEFMPGGFISVDIFFVISGFLISTILFHGIQNDSFKFLDFYARRIRRIFPALLIVFIFCISFGWVFLLPDEYRQLGKHICGGSVFLSNFFLWHEIGYFDIDADTKPLLHLWSLGIEEQFYILWPLLLYVAFKRNLNFFSITLGFTLCSFVLNIDWAYANKAAAFFSPLARFWELLSGGLLAWLLLKNVKIIPILKQEIIMERGVLFNFQIIFYRHLTSIISLVGACMILSGLYLINRTSNFPGYWALLPVCGSMLLIGAGHEACVNKYILSSRIFIWFGLISYPLYLWQWPLLSFLRIIEGETPGINSRILVALGSILLAWITYKYIETPIRKSKQTRKITILLTLLMFLMGLAGYAIYINNGFPMRFKQYNHILSQFGWGNSQKDSLCTSKYLRKNQDFEFCRLAKNSEPTIVLFGDSFAFQLYSGLSNEVKNTPDNVLSINQGACVSFLGYSPREDYALCESSARLALDIIISNKNVETVILSASPYYFNSKTKKLLDIGVVPHSNQKLTSMVQNYEFYRSTFRGGY